MKLSIDSFQHPQHTAFLLFSKHLQVKIVQLLEKYCTLHMSLPSAFPTQNLLHTDVEPNYEAFVCADKPIIS